MPQNAVFTETLLPYPELALEIEALLKDPHVQVPARLVEPLHGGGSLFVMPAHDQQVAISKIITTNVGTERPSIQGDVLVIDTATGTRQLVLDGPTVTARRTAAVSLLAAQHLAPNKTGPVLIVGAGVQGKAHLEAFAQGLGIKDFYIASRTQQGAAALIAHAFDLGLHAVYAPNPNMAMAACPIVVTCTPAQSIVLNAKPQQDTFIAAVGAFTPKMAELSADLCQHMVTQGFVAVDTSDASHEAGDLLQARIDVASLPTLQAIVQNRLTAPSGKPVLFKSCGWGGWDLAAARLAMRQATTQPQNA